MGEQELDRLIDRLRAADPAGPVPTADSPAGRAMLDRVLSSGAHAPRPQPIAAGASPTDEPVEGYVFEPAAARPRRSRRLVAAGALAATAAGVAALVVVGPGNGRSSAAAEVQQAAVASSAAALDSLDLSAELSIGELSGSFDLVLAGDDLAVTAELDLASLDNGPAAGFLPSGPIELRVVDGETYLDTDQRGWLHLGDGSRRGMPGWGLELPPIDPDELRSVFDQLETISNAELVGRETIGGEELTHYRGRVTHTVEDHGGPLGGWLGDEPVEVAIDLYVTDDDLVRRVTASGELPASLGAASVFGVDGPFSIEITLDYDAGRTVEAPESYTEAAAFELPGVPDLGNVPDTGDSGDTSDGSATGPWADTPWADAPWADLPWSDLPWTDIPWSSLPVDGPWLDGLDGWQPSIAEFEQWLGQISEWTDGVLAESLGRLDPELGAALRDLTELVERRPGLCAEIDPATAGGDPLAAWETCLRDEGETAAADALATVRETIAG